MTGAVNGHDRNIQAVLELLAETWPAAFSVYENRRRPLRIGIHTEILAALDGAITPIELRAALGCYVANPVYRARLVAGAVRIGLGGQPAGVVTPEQIPPARPSPSPSPTRHHLRHRRHLPRDGFPSPTCGRRQLSGGKHEQRTPKISRRNCAFLRPLLHFQKWIDDHEQ
jgi:sRNA-binding protein